MRVQGARKEAVGCLGSPSFYVGPHRVPGRRTGKLLYRHDPDLARAAALVENHLRVLLGDLP